MNNPKDAWMKAQESIKAEIGEESYEIWFNPLRAEFRAPGTLLLQAPDEFFRDWIRDHYLNIIKENLQKLSTGSIQVDLSVIPQQGGSPNLSLEEPKKVPAPQIAPLPAFLNPKYTFESFVVGPSNRFAHAASLAVANYPARAYNPLFIYGGVGLGKTHLMQAIARQVLNTKPDLKISYLTSERFTNELISAIQHRATQKFREKYRNVDVLLIDDIHFIAGKESTQEEFFHTFNALYDAHKQIIICSDRPPKEIPRLEERLISRFGWGLITDIQVPDLETRIAILRKKIEKEPVNIPNEIIDFIAQTIKTNIRELEGALIRVIAYSLLEEKEISLSLTKEILRDILKETEKVVSVKLIQDKVGEFFDINPQNLKAKKRNKNLILPRQIAMYLGRELTGLSLPEIGNEFGGKDHTTILYAYNKIKNSLKKDVELKNKVQRIIQNINSFTTAT